MTPHRTGQTGGLLHTVERIVYLRGLTGFNAVPPEALGPIANALHERTFRKGEVVGEPGEVSKYVYIVVEGAIELQTPGQPAVVQGPTATVGFVPVFCGVKRASRAIATVDTLTLEMEAESVFDVYEDPIHGFSLLMSGLHAVAGDYLDTVARLPIETSTVTGPPGSAPTSANNWVDRLLLLRTLPLFAGADPDALATFARTLERVTVAPGKPLWPDAARGVPMFLVRGQVNRGPVEAGEAGAVCEAPCALGLLEALAHRPPPMATAVGEVVALRGDFERLLDVIEDEKSIGVGLIRALVRVFLELGLSD